MNMENKKYIRTATNAELKAWLPDWHCERELARRNRRRNKRRKPVKLLEDATEPVAVPSGRRSLL